MRDAPGRSLPVLRYGQFYGAANRTREVGGFALAERDADPRLHVPRHTHDSAHFIFVLSGPYLTGALGAPAVCLQPTLVYNPPGTTHRDTFAHVNGRAEGRFASIGISDPCMVRLLEHARLPARSIVMRGARGLSLAARVVRECRLNEPGSALTIEGLCLELAGESAGEETPFARGGAPRWLRAAVDLLHDDPGRAVTVRGIARECGVHPVHLARVFRRFLGCTPGDYARRARIERAAALLAGGSLALTEVALAAGFADQSHMTRSFRRACSITPGEYRRLLGRS